MTDGLTVLVEGASGVPPRDGVSSTTGRRRGRDFVTPRDLDTAAAEAVVFLAGALGAAFFEEDAFWAGWLVVLERVVIAEKAIGR